MALLIIVHKWQSIKGTSFSKFESRRSPCLNLVLYCSPKCFHCKTGKSTFWKGRSVWFIFLNHVIFHTSMLTSKFHCKGMTVYHIKRASRWMKQLGYINCGVFQNNRDSLNIQRSLLIVESMWRKLHRKAWWDETLNRTSQYRDLKPVSVCAPISARTPQYGISLIMNEISVFEVRRNAVVPPEEPSSREACNLMWTTL